MYRNIKRWSFSPIFCAVSLFAAATLPLTASAQDDLAGAAVITGAPANAEKTGGTILIYDSYTSQNDQGFIETARLGAERAKVELGMEYQDVRVVDVEKRQALLVNLLKGGVTQVVAVGFQYVVPVLKIAEAYPQVKFTVIDGIVPPIFANVQSVEFKNNEGAFIVGMIAAYTSKSHVLGFVGGMDVPLIRNFAYGFVQGAKYIDPKVTVKVEMVGTDKTAWSNPAKGYALAEKLFSEGADVVFAAAGGSGLGVLKAAKDKERLAIGVDSNQNGLYPGTVLTSMVKRVDRVIFNTLKSVHEGNWKPGIKYLGINESALDYAVDNNNRDLISSELINKVETTKDLISRGLVEVEFYSPE